MSLRYLGMTIFRVWAPLLSVAHIPNLTPGTTWWHVPSGHCYGSLVDDESEMLKKKEQMYEIAVRKVVDRKAI
jgi:salicylate hydroxylase